MEYRPRSGPCYGPSGYGVAHGNGGYGGGHGNGGYAGGYSNGTYAGAHGNGAYGYGGGDGRYLPYGRGGAVPGYGVGAGVGQPLAAAMPSTSHGHVRGRGWGGDQHLRGVWAPPPTILPEAMRAAEAAAGEVVLRVHPTEAAERRRHEVIDYAKRLIGTTFGCEVYEYGSVPLKTYLPDGDLDITILTNTPLDDTFIEDVRHFLESEAKNDDAQFVLKDIKVISAKVQLIKCVIDNFVMDITFNQVGGVSTLCLLELVDSEIGKDHLFKRTIILIKAWCYHESNIHGSSQGLLSTYAVEILILHVFNMFHKTLHGPLEALYKFLEYYSNFDWDKHWLTLNGPMTVSSRCNFTKSVALNDELLLSRESMKSSLDRLIVLPIGSEGPDTGCPTYQINIIDPLKGDNNLGRSINIENLPHIKNAFKFGAQKLGQILKLPSELIPDGIYGFFATTLGRHGRGERPDLGDSVSFQYVPDSGHGQRKHVSSLGNSYVDKNENRSPNSLLELTDKESDVKTNMHQSSGLTNFRSHSPSSLESGNEIIKQCHNDSETNADIPVARSFVQKNHILTSSTRANTLDVSGFYRVKSNWTGDSQEKLQLPPFTPSNLLDLSGDLSLPSKCLRSVQYNLEALFAKLLESVKEAYLAGLLDENSFNSSTLLLSDADGRKLSKVKCSQGTRDVPQQSITEAQSLSGTHIPSSGLSLYPPADHNPWFQNTEGTPQTCGAGMYIPDMNFSLPPRTDTPPIGSTFYPTLSVDKENFPFSPYITGDIGKRRGTGTYIPKQPYEIGKEKSWYDKRQKQRQPDQVYADSKPYQVNSCSAHAAVERALTNGENKQVPTSKTTENGEQRCENGSIETRMLPPPRIALPHNDGGSQGNLPVPSTGQPSPPAVTVAKPAVTMVNSQSITSQQHENLEFGTMGPFSATRLTAKFIEDFPPLSGTKKPVQTAPALTVKSPKLGASTVKSWPVEATGSAVQGPRAGVSVTQSRPVEASDSTVQSPSPSASAAQCRPEESYQLKDDADFPPLQAGTRYKAEFPPLRAAAH